MKSGLYGLALVLGVAIAPAANAVTITAYNQFNPPGAWSQIDTYDPAGASNVFTYSGSGYTEAVAPQPNSAAPPLGNTTQYITVLQNGALTVTGFAAGTAQSLGLFWGSIDFYNSIEFKLGGSTVAQFTGSNAAIPANGNQSASFNDTNKYVVFAGVGLFDTVIFRSTNFSFEFDNLAISSDNNPVGDVPLPGALALFAGGLGVVGLLSRRRRKSLAKA